MSTPFTLPTVRLGDTGPEVGAQGLGCMGMSFAYGPTDAEAALATLERALERGVTLFDTADAYADGANEEFLAPFFKAHREEVTVATKFALAMDPADPKKRIISNEPGYIRACAEDSLRRLGTEVIDLYYMHRRDPAQPIEQTVAVMAELVEAGKVRHLGLSEVTGEELRAAHAVHPIAAVQSEWSVFSRDIERGVVPVAAELGIALVPYSPLGRGFLTGAFVQAESELGADDFRRQQPRFTGDNARANAGLLTPLREIAAAHDASPGQIALAWVHQQTEKFGLPVVPIPGTRKSARVEENTGAAAIRLSEAELALLEPLAAQVAGDRYADMTFTSAGREGTRH